MESSKLIQTVRRAQQGNVDSFQELYLDTYKNVFYLTLQMLQEPDEAESMTQEIFISVFATIEQLGEPALFYRWLSNKAAETCTGLLRETRRLYDDVPEDFKPGKLPLSDVFPLPDRPVDDAGTRALIMKAVGQLPVMPRVCVLYHYFQRLTLPEIAENLAVSQQSVKRELAFARDRIRNELESALEDQERWLYVTPLPLPPIFHMALQEFEMPRECAELVWRRVAERIRGLPKQPRAMDGVTPSPNPPIKRL